MSSTPQGTGIPSACHKGIEYGDSSTQKIEVRTVSSNLSHAKETKAADTLWILKHERSTAMIPSPEYEKPCHNMEVAKNSPIRLLAELEVVTYEPRGTSPSVTPPGRPSLPTSIAGSLQHEAIAGQAPSLLVDVSRPIKSPTPTTSMILAPYHNNQIHAICSAGFNTSLQLPMDQNWVQFCRSNHLRGQCYSN